MSMEKERAVVHLFFFLRRSNVNSWLKGPHPAQFSQTFGALSLWSMASPPWRAPLIGGFLNVRNWEKNLVGKSGNKEVTGKPQPVGSNKFLDKQHIFLPFESEGKEKFTYL